MEIFPSSSSLNALSGTQSADGQPYPTIGETPWYTDAFKAQYWADQATQQSNALRVYKSADLTFGIYPGSFRKANGTIVTYAGSSANAISVSSTLKIWLTNSGTLTTGASYPTAGDILRLGTVTADPASITTITNDRVVCVTDTFGSGGVTLPIAQSDVTGLVSTLATKASTANNLSDLANATTARTNLALGKTNEVYFDRVDLPWNHGDMIRCGFNDLYSGFWMGMSSNGEILSLFANRSDNFGIVQLVANSVARLEVSQGGVSIMNGNLFMNANGIQLDGDSSILGSGGTITLNAPDGEISIDCGSGVSLPNSHLNMMSNALLMNGGVGAGGGSIVMDAGLIHMGDGSADTGGGNLYMANGNINEVGQLSFLNGASSIQMNSGAIAMAGGVVDLGTGGSISGPDGSANIGVIQTSIITVGSTIGMGTDSSLQYDGTGINITTSQLSINAVPGFTGSGAFTVLTILNGIITNAE